MTDPNGRPRAWWQDATADEFVERAKAMSISERRDLRAELGASIVKITRRAQDKTLGKEARRLAEVALAFAVEKRQRLYPLLDGQVNDQVAALIESAEDLTRAGDYGEALLALASALRVKFGLPAASEAEDGGDS